MTSTSYRPSVLDQPLPTQLTQRYWSKVDVREPNECWPWKTCRETGKYGQFRVGGKMEIAHRVAWALENGPIVPITLQVLHHCDNPPCCNPAHLFLGTNYDNVLDKIAKGRSSYPHPWRQGEKHPCAKLTQADVDNIRVAWSSAPGQASELAARYSVSKSTIYNIINRTRWL